MLPRAKRSGETVTKVSVINQRHKHETQGWRYRRVRKAQGAKPQHYVAGEKVREGSVDEQKDSEKK